MFVSRFVPPKYLRGVGAAQNSFLHPQGSADRPRFDKRCFEQPKLAICRVVVVVVCEDSLGASNARARGVDSSLKFKAGEPCYPSSQRNKS